MKNALALLLVASLVPLAAAQVSQEEAGLTCNQYSLEGETVQVRGPLTCEGSYWACEFLYFGNRRNLLVAVGVSGEVLQPDSGLLEDLIHTQYAVDNGALFSTPLSDRNFAIQLAGMNATLQNYESRLAKAKEDGYIDAPAFVNYKEGLENVGRSAVELSGMVAGLSNASAEFADSPDCIELINYKEGLNNTLEAAGNFTALWLGFIEEYNDLASDIQEPYMAAINPGDARILKESVEGIEPAIRDYYGDEASYTGTTLSNLETRFERVETRGRLDDAYEIVKGSGVNEAVDKYNQASQAFSDGEYQTARALVAEALVLASADQPDGEEEESAIEEVRTDYTLYLSAIAVLLLALFVLVMLKKRGDWGDGEGEEEDEEEERSSKGKGGRGAKVKWSWSRNKDSSLGRL